MAQITRSSRQRDSVAALLASSDEFLSAQQVHTDLRASGTSIGLATVYRALASLVEAGEIDSLRSPDGETVYRACSTEHHHHLVCRNCGQAVEVSGPTVERWASKVAAEHGFSNVSHTVELMGLCANCSAQQSVSAASSVRQSQT